MDQSKFRKIVIASTVTAVILLVTLLSVMVYQLVSIFTYKKRDRRAGKGDRRVRADD